MDSFYTLALWRVREGEERAFLQTWRDELAAAFRAVSPTAQGTLIQSLDDPCLFYSFGPWESLEQLQAARGDPRTRAAFASIIALCEEATPGAYRVVLAIP